MYIHIRLKPGSLLASPHSNLYIHALRTVNSSLPAPKILALKPVWREEDIMEGGFDDVMIQYYQA